MLATIPAADNRLRMVRFRPFKSGHGPRFTMTTWDTGRRDNRGGSYVAYRLTIQGESKSPVSRVLFSGDDYSPSPMHAIDSDAAIAGLMGFLCLRPGDTDPDYFADYTDDQRRFCDLYAEALAFEAMARFGDD